MNTDLLSQNQLQPLTFLYDLISVLIKIQLLVCLIDGGNKRKCSFGAISEAKSNTGDSSIILEYGYFLIIFDKNYTPRNFSQERVLGYR